MKNILGLDIGTNSVGWCLTDENFKIQKCFNKDTWGVRLFDEAKGCKERRNYRASRRRYTRRKSRLYLLNKLFYYPIIDSNNGPKDVNFFIRLNESNLLLEDKEIKVKNSLFADSKLEKEYYKKYPTIYHLRKAMITNEDYAFSDVRFLYLAVHHIFKYRGNFINDGEFKDNKVINSEDIEKLNEYLKNIYIEENGIIDDLEECPKFSVSNKDELLNILLKDEYNKLKDKEIRQLFSNLHVVEKKSNTDEIISYFISLILGKDSKVPFLGEDEQVKINLSSNFDDKIGDIYSDEVLQITLIAKNIFDVFYIKQYLKNNDFISDAFVNQYEEHKKQLRYLKEICKDIDSNNNSLEIYKKVFINKEEKENYYSLINDRKNTSADVFNRFIKKEVLSKKEFLSKEKIFDDGRTYLEVFEEMEKLVDQKKLLNTISQINSSIFPHKLHQIELEKILDNAKLHFNFANDEFKKQLIDLFSFRIPYYYGPLNEKEGKNTFVVKYIGHENENITYSNYKEIINDEETKKKFIDVRLNSCLYLKGRQVLPRYSIYYVTYDILNKLNSMTSNGVKLFSSFKDKEIALRILTEKDSFTIKQFVNRFNQEKGDFNLDDDAIGGINKKDKLSFYPVNKFIKVYGTKENLLKNIQTIEKVIRILTIYKDNKKDGLNLIKESFDFSSEQFNLIKTLNFKDYGSFSKDFLKDLKIIENKSILDLLYETSQNFEQIRNNPEFDVQGKVDLNNKEYFFQEDKEKYNPVDEILNNLPAKSRRSLIQSLRIIKEVKAATKKDIDVIVIESTREDLKSKNKTEKDSRKKQIQNFIKKLTGEDKKNLTKDLDDIEEIKLNSKFYYLYFLQDGKDLYTGEEININDLNTGKYNIDHIFPQSQIKDDSLDNLALVNTDLNQKVKKDIYPLPNEIRENKKVTDLWFFLKQKGVMSTEKYNRLIRSRPLSDDDKHDFVNAQLKVVDFVNISLRDIIKIKHPNTQVIFSKSQYPLEVRKQLKIYKNRELNDCHHAIDAYLNNICGYLLNERYNKKFYLQTNKLNGNDEEKSYNFINYLLWAIRNKYFLEDDIKNNALRTDMFMTYRAKYGDEAFYNANFDKKGGLALVPAHTKNKLNDTSKYGGYNSVSTYYMLVRKDKKNNNVLVNVNTIDYYSSLVNGKLNLEKLFENIKVKDQDLKESFCGNKPILNYVKVISKDGGNYLISSQNSLQVRVQPLFYNPISFNENKIYHTLLKYEKPYSFENGVYSFGANRKKDGCINISNNEIDDFYDKLVNYTKDKRYSIYSAISSYKIIVDFKEKDYEFKRKEILDLVYKFNRDFSKPSTVRISKSKILQLVDYIVEDSVTGLFIKKIKVE